MPSRWRLLAASLAVGVLALAGVVGPRVRLLEPPATVRLLDRHGRFLGEVGAPQDERLGFWPVAELPPRVVAATLVIEDKRFYDHVGVDVFAVGRALKQNATNSERVSGASTIPMQVARLQDPGPRTWPRKAVEGLTAVALEARFGREAVLRQYLVLAPYGNNVHGVAYAARRYFDKPVEDLSWAETALLASLPQAPGSMNLYRENGRKLAAERATRILDLLRDEGTLTPLERDVAVGELATLTPVPRPERPAATMHPVLRLEAELPQAWRAAPLVSTSLDLDVQERTQATLAEALHHWEARGAGNAAALVVDWRTGEVVASVGSADWFDPRFAGTVDFTRVERQPGSTLKPLLYAAALDQGVITPGTVLDDLGRGPNAVMNADERFLGPLLPRFALANSRNVPAVLLLEQLGLDRAYGLYRELGLHDDAYPVERYGLGLAIGGMPVSLEHLVRAYTALAGDGAVRELSWEAGQRGALGEPVLSSGAAHAVGLYLSDPMARLPTFPRGGNTELPFPAAMKTGTSSDFRDAWAVGWTDRYVVGVWVGHPDATPMRGLSGYSAGALLVRELMIALHDEGDGVATFAPPDGWEPVATCALSGDRATPLCDRVITEHYPKEHVPTSSCAMHREERGHTVVELPPRYAAWARREGLPVASNRLAAAEPDRVSIVAPRDGQRLLRDPEAPDGRDTLLLRAEANPGIGAVVWSVDGVPVAVAEPPFEARWVITPGEHRIEARAAYVDGVRDVARVVGL